MRIEKSRIINNEKEALAYYLLMVESTQDGTKTIEERDGWYELVEVTPAPVEPIPLEEQYSDRVGELIRERYSINDELAILRQRDTKPTEYVEYYNYCEQCKLTAKAEIYPAEGEENEHIEG